jgi:3-phenylpropionate/trans-cinnamate dioxygenase ferredoxin subunit
MEEFIHLTTTDGIESGGMKVATLDDHELLVANADGQYFVCDARCPHMGGHLADGALEGTVITCPRHHSQFDLRDGRALRWTDWEGAQLSIAKMLRHPRTLRTYEVKVEGNEVLVGPQKTPPSSD